MKRKTLATLIITALIISAGLSGCNKAENPAAQSVPAGTENSGNEGTAMEQVYHAELPTGVENSKIFVQKIDSLPDDFIMGMDISSLLVEEASGVKYYDENGQEQDLMKILADSGINCVRVRVWVDPFDKEGHGYGGGNCNAETAATIGSRAAAYGMKTCVDLHYSDFWADPSKQMVPRAWEGMSLDEKAAALSEYTKETLNTVINAGADVSMVQVGNEINNGMSGEKGLNNKLKLVKAGCDAIRQISSETGKDILITLHYTQVDDSKNIMEIARQLQSAKVDYDVFGISYYPYWHGSIENMTQILKDVSSTYNVKTCIMETSYPYTDEDGDGNANSVSGTSLKTTYPVSVQGQANAVRDIMEAAVDAQSLGLFYWEGAWIPVGSDPASNKDKWENLGSGWASSYASEYDPDDAGKYYGGCSWDNQAMFDFEGKKLPSLDVFKYVRYGAVGEEVSILTDLSAEDAISVDVSIGGELKMPETLDVVYNDTSLKDPLKITWNEDDLSAIDTAIAGTYTVSGKAVSDAMPGKEISVKATVDVSNINYILNPGFEDEITGEWSYTTYEGKNAADIQDKEADAHGGTKAYHFYSAKEFSCDLQQNVTEIPAGNYTLTAYTQGGDMGEEGYVIMYIYVNSDRYESEVIKPDGWQNWKEMKIKDIMINEGDTVIVGCITVSGAGGWGTVDDFDLSLSVAE